MRICFLDVDGVLNTSSSWGTPEIVNPVFVKNVSRLVRATDAKVVLSTSWRLSLPLEKIERLLKDNGFFGQIIGTTPLLDERAYIPRRLEIKEWLRENSEVLDVNSYVVIDDDEDTCLERDRFVWCKDGCGFREEHRNKAIEILERPLWTTTD